MKHIVTAIILAVMAASASAYSDSEMETATKLAVTSFKCKERGFERSIGLQHIAFALARGKGTHATLKAMDAMADATEKLFDKWDAIIDVVMDDQYADGGEENLRFMCGEWLHKETRRFLLRK
jgi:hypothetical protein